MKYEKSVKDPSLHQSQKLLLDLQSLLGKTLTRTEALAPITSKASYEVTLYPTQSLKSIKNIFFYVVVNIGLNCYIEMTQNDAYNYINGIIDKNKGLEIPTKASFNAKEIDQTLLNIKNGNKKEIYSQLSESKIENLKLPCIEIKEEYDSSGKQMTGEIFNLERTLKSWNKNITSKENNYRKRTQCLVKSLSQNGYEVDTENLTVVDNTEVIANDKEIYKELNKSERSKTLTNERYDVITKKIEELALEEELHAKLSLNEGGSQRKGRKKGFIGNNFNQREESNFKDKEKKLFKIEPSNIHKQKNINFTTKTIKLDVLERTPFSYDVLNNKWSHVENEIKHETSKMDNKTEKRQSRFLKNRQKIHNYGSSQ